MIKVTSLGQTYRYQGKAYGPFQGTAERPYVEVPLGVALASGAPEYQEPEAQADADEGEGIHVDQILQANADLKANLDGVYSERAHLVAALSKYWPASIERHDGEDWDDQWRNVVIIDLPTGQVSWHIALTDLDLFAHLPRDAGRTWDGHTTGEKYDRLDDLAELDIVTLLADLDRERAHQAETLEQLASRQARTQELEAERDEAKRELDIARTERDAAKAQADATPAAPGPVTLPDGLRADLIALKGISEQRADEILGMVNAALNPAPAPAPEVDPQ